MPKKIALLIGVSEYGEGIPPLSSALNDVEAMQRVLQNPSLGGFDQVERLLNPTDSKMRRAIQKLFREAAKDDLVLLFFSGHGITNDDGHLYLTTQNTAKNDFEATAVDANFIQGQSNNCYAKRQVLILDACYSGAIAQGWRTKSVGVDLKKQLGAEGRVILTSSSATQTSFEQEILPLSLYTQYLVEGIETGAADTDNDGNIHVQELHAYAKAKVQAVKPKMTPEIILDKEGFNILLSSAPRNPEAEYRKLVEQYAQNGELSKLSYLILKPKRKTFKITDEKAEEIETEVLEPLRRRFANLESYKQVFVEVVEQKYPVDEHTRKILKDYQQDILGLRDEDVAPIELEITSAKKAEYRKQVQIQKQQEKEEYENSLRYYEQEFTKAIKVQYPLDEYVRNGLKQFQQSLGLNDEDIERIEAPLLTRKQAEYQKQQQQAKKQRQEQQSIQTTTVKPTQQNNDLSSEKGIDYTRLRDLLKAYEWEEADKETLAVMLKAVDREQKVWLDPESIKNFPSADLRTIDQLWVKYSDGRFGFSVQKRIWESVAKDYTKLGDRVGWRTYETVIYNKIVECLEDINKNLGFKEEDVTRTGAQWIYYTDLSFDIDAPEGHLPATLARGEGEHNDFGGGWVCVPGLLSHPEL
ncbi:GUN4 domain-containing protein [Scytonema hofmannii FACHB-248]|uniref:GUN4 domain-containing protein n=1 Tax=Scytonema hofmannii FACHB-248 TaxID=1842502 RepID=A0ABR8GV46_9CYAN|nr:MULTISPECIES: GUN4 domain-containing protein [Nostocales]MBD2606946.1 GUN4 domain-containing protein [Scytonema hofmannii FACHB-248]